MSEYDLSDTMNLQMFMGTAVKTVQTAQPGVLITLNNLLPIFKTEYSDAKKGSDDYHPICYNHAGERWHGDYDTPCVEVLIH